MPLRNNIHGTYNSVYTQKIMNGLPSWSRARMYPESYANRVINSVGMYIEDAHRQIRAATRNRFASSYDAFLSGVLVQADIPQNLLFTVMTVDGKRVYVKPTVLATDGVTSNISVAIVDDLEDLNHALPTRISISTTSHAVTNVMDATVVSLLSGATINDIAEPNWLFTTVSGGTDFGSVDDIRFFYPGAVVLNGVLAKGTDSTEGRIFHNDNVARSWHKFQSLTSVTAENVDSTATVTVDSWGFNRPRLLERVTTYHIPDDREIRSFYYEREVDGSSRSLLKYMLRDTENIGLRRSGYSGLSEQLAIYLTDTGGSHVELNDIAKMDNSDLLFAIDDDTLYVYDVYLPAIDNSFVLDTMKLRLADPHIALETTPVMRRHFEIGETFKVATHNRFAVSNFSKPVRVRLYTVDDAGAIVYLEKDGSVAATPEDAWRYPPLNTRGTAIWNERRWTVSFSSIGQVALVLETQFLSITRNAISGYSIDKTEYDVIPIMIGEKRALAEFALDAGVQPAVGLTFDSDNNLWLRTTNGGNFARPINLHFDVGLIDYRGYKIYFREEYTEVESIITTGEPVHNPTVVNP